MIVADNTLRYIFRITHYKNIEYILDNGIYCREHDMCDSNYINIGDAVLIEQRNVYAVGINPPGGNLGSFIPFYFGGHSPMLLNIKTGYREVTKLDQSDIVFIICKIKDIIDNCPEWCFTDGHAKNRITEFFNKAEDLVNVDWDVVKEKQWASTEEDPDRPRRKQAEFLVKTHVPIGCISAIVVKNDQKKQYVENLIRSKGISMQVAIDKNDQYFYHDKLCNR